MIIGFDECGGEMLSEWRRVMAEGEEKTFTHLRKVICSIQQPDTDDLMEETISHVIEWENVGI